MRTLFVEVKITDKKGRGLFAVKKINKGDLLEVSPTIDVSRSQIDKNLANYVFYHPEHRTKSLVALGYGSLFNHSLSPNVDWKISKDGNYFVVVFKAKRKIDKGDELSIDYGYKPKGYVEE